MTNLWLPSVKGNPTVIQGQGDTDNAADFIIAWMQALGDRADIMRQDSRLTLCAQTHATWLAQRQDMEPTMHLGKNNSTPNQRLIASGFRPPSFWKPEKNNCEACAVHHDGPLEALELLLKSPGHRPLVLGERVSDWFWASHTVWGLGNAGPFYSLVVAPPEGSQG